MKEDILKFLGGMGVADTESEAMDDLCRMVCGQLDAMLADGVSPEDCACAYVPAAAWMMLDWMQACKGLDSISMLSAGDITLRRAQNGRDGTRRALELLRPWLKDRTFAFVGVRG